MVILASCLTGVDMSVYGNRRARRKLTDSDRDCIEGLLKIREEMKRQISELTNAKIAEKMEVHTRTIDRITSARCVK